MSYNYLIPVVGTLPRGYVCTIEPPFHLVGKLLNAAEARVLWRTRVFHKGGVQKTFESELTYRNGQLQQAKPPGRMCRIVSEDADDEPGFFENDFVIANGDPLFTSNMHPSGYVIYAAPGRKSFFSDCAYKYASPPVIDQIATYGRFADSYPPVSVDRERDEGETIIMINPYSRDIIAEVISSDGRQLRRIRVPATRARLVPLVDLVKPDETAWHGRIQISANNRVITFDIKHSLRNPEIIHDHEHLDPFRADPTHVPAFQWFRMMVGKFLLLRAGIVRR